MKEKHVIDDFELVNRMRKNDQHAFSTLFIKYHSDLLLYCGTFIADRNECEDIIQSIFLELWEKRTESVSYTHLDVYKRQVNTSKYGSGNRIEIFIIRTTDYVRTVLRIPSFRIFAEAQNIVGTKIDAQTLNTQFLCQMLGDGITDSDIFQAEIGAIEQPKIGHCIVVA